MKRREVLALFNRGLISRFAQARIDVGRVALSAETQTNWIPRTLGSMMLRPGWAYKGTIAGNGAYVPFIYSNSDTAILELSASTMRVWDDGDTLVTRPEVDTTVSNGTFTTNLNSWTDADESGAASTWSAGAMKLLGTGYAAAKRRQQITIASEDQDVPHALRIVVDRGPVLLRIGTSAGNDNLFRQAVLRTGVHSIAFTPTGATVHVQFSSALKYPVLVGSCMIEGAGTLELPTPWTSATICKNVRYVQSADVLFCACDGYQQRRIERRDNNSWSVALYEVNDGPFLTENVENIRLTPDAISGEVTLTSSQALFRSGHVGSIFRISSQGQLVEADAGAELVYTNPIRVTGVDEGRVFQVIRAGTWSGTISLQRSIGEPGAWVTVATYTGNGSNDFNDELDNSIAYYRLGIEAGNYSSGTAELSLEYSVGSITGTVRVTGYTSSTEVDGIVLSDLGDTAASEVWAEGAWSDVSGWPSAVTIWEGRIWWGGNWRNYGSVPDAFHSFDPEVVGDSGPINRRAGEGPIGQINWMLPLQRLVIGADNAEHTIRSTSFDEPVTPSNYNTRAPSTKGSAAVPAAVADGVGYFVDRTGRKIFELSYDAQSYDFKAVNVSLLVPEIGEAGFTRLATQMSPDVRVHCLRSDGTAAVLIRDALEDVLCWIEVETDGVIEDVVVLPGAVEDRVFYRVRRNINGTNVRYHEEWAREEQCRGGALNLQADSFITGSGSTTTIGGLDHLEGESVVVWADGMDHGSYTVSGGQIALSAAVSEWCVGLPYVATYKCAKLAAETEMGLALGPRGRINKIGLVLADTHESGLEFGPRLGIMDGLPRIENSVEVEDDRIWEAYGQEMIVFNGDWSNDPRIWLRATAPRPCTVLAAMINIERHDAQ